MTRPPFPEDVMNPRPWAAVLPIVLGLACLSVSADDKGRPEQKAPPAKAEGKEPGLPPGPQGGFRPGGGPPMMGQVREIVKQFDKDGDGRLNREERKAARDFLQKERARGGFRPGGPGGPGGPGRPGGFAPGSFLIKPLMEALDTDKDGKLSRAEVVAGARKLFSAADKDEKGALSEAQLAAGINDLLPRPPNFRGGPPGGNPPGGPPGRGPGGFGPGGFGPGAFIAGNIVKRADKDKDGKVTRAELVAAAEAMFTEADKDRDGKLDEKELGAAIGQLFPTPQGRPGGFGPPGGPGGPGGFGRGNREPPKAGPKVKPEEVKASSEPLYSPNVMRTFFLKFEDSDWEAQLADFYHTDVQVPATLIVDGKTYPDVGVRFRGNSSFFRVSAGYKRSLKISLDFIHEKQRLHGYKTLTLLNSADDPSFLHAVLFAQVAREHIPAPKANLVRVAINGESWGVYANVQAFNKDFTRDFFRSSKGTRWKVPGHSGARAGLEYTGESIESYKRQFRIKSADKEKAWKALIALCRMLNQTPLDRLEAALKPIFDIDGALWFLALDNALINNDGYWVRASDYNLYLDEKGKFHLIAHDINETFSPVESFGFGPPGRGPGGPGGRGGPGAQGRPGGVELDPLIGLNDSTKPLRSRLLAVPALRERYLKCVRTIAEKDLDWSKLGPVVAGYRKLIEKDVEADTRKLYSLAAFKAAFEERAEEVTARGHEMSLRSFAEKRRRYLLDRTQPGKTTKEGEGR
jgi:Ca2+-binding EF-hand superfamily protein